MAKKQNINYFVEQEKRNQEEAEKFRIAMMKEKAVTPKPETTSKASTEKKNKTDKSVSASYQFYIPLDLDKKVRQYCFDNRETKTKLFIDAITMYLDTKGY